jgi:hypothetical protein
VSVQRWVWYSGYASKQPRHSTRSVCFLSCSSDAFDGCSSSILISIPGGSSVTNAGGWQVGICASMSESKSRIGIGSPLGGVTWDPLIVASSKIVSVVCIVVKINMAALIQCHRCFFLSTGLLIRRIRTPVKCFNPSRRAEYYSNQCRNPYRSRS